MLRCESRRIVLCHLKRDLIFSFFLFSLIGGCKNPQEFDLTPVGSTIIGRVLDSQNQPIRYARVSLLSGGQRHSIVLSDEQGSFKFNNIPATKFRIKIVRAGYDDYEAQVPSGVNDTSRLEGKLQRKSSVPTTKPLSSGPVRIRGIILEEDFDRNGTYQPFKVKGVAFSPAPIGSSGDVPSVVHDRSVEWLDSLHANTIRTYNGVAPYMLARAAEHNIRVIVGFWIQTDYNLADPTVRDQLIESFRSFVSSLKDQPGVLFWNLGNEQNLPWLNGNNPYWYDLVQELAITAFEVEGASYHPVCASNGDFTNIGDPSKRADDASLTYMDLWASNMYQMNLAPSFASYRTRTQKPIVLTEWGIDALDNRTKLEYEDTQARIDSTNWVQILSASDVCVGGTAFEFTDEWWKAGNPSSHEYGGYSTPNHPDGYSNEEWWGLVAVTPDANGDGLDEWRARKVFRLFQRLWK